MSYMHPAALAARRKYWTRPDAVNGALASVELVIPQIG